MKKIVQFLLRVLPAGFLLVGAGGCIKDTIDLEHFSDRFELTPGIALPLGYGSLGMDDLIARFDSTGFVKKDASGLLELSYNSQLLSLKASDVVSIPDQHFDQFFVRSEIALPTITDSVVLNKSKDYAFSLQSDERIDSIILKAGNFHFSIQSTFRHTGRLVVSSSYILKNGKAWKEEFYIGNTSGTYQGEFDRSLSGLALHLLHRNDSTLLPLNFSLTLYSDDGQPLQSSDQVTIDLGLLNIGFRLIYGNIGYKEFLAQQSSILVNLFEKSEIGGTIEFEDPRFTVQIDNAYGMPILMEFTNVYSSSERQNITVPISFPPEENPVQINYPALNEIGLSKQTLFTFENSNPPFRDVMQTEPNKIHFTTRAYTDISKAGSTNFVLDTSRFTASVNVVLPVWLRAGEFVLRDTIDFDFQNMLGEKERSLIDTLVLYLEVNNGLPLNVGVQLAFVDASYQVLDSLFDSNSLPQVPSGKLSADYTVDQQTGKTLKKTYAGIGKDKIKRIENARYAIVSAELNTTDFQTNPSLKVKFYDYYKLDFKLAAKALLRINNDNIP